MPTVNTSVVNELIAPSILLFLLLGSFAGVALGSGLLASSSATFVLLRKLNRWVSTRRALKPVEIPREMKAGLTHSRWFGVAFTAAGAYSLYALLVQVGTMRVSVTLHLGTFGAIGVETLLWFLVVGSVLAVAAGAMLLLFPRSWNAIEAVANRWVSTRRLAHEGDTMRLPLDRLVEAYPRKAGWAILVLSVLATIDFAILLVGR